jgi:hypothetical protein
MGVECRRVIDRLRLEGIFDDRELSDTIVQLSQIEKAIRRVRITRQIIHAASQTMPTIVKTLAAFHLDRHGYPGPTPD